MKKRVLKVHRPYPLAWFASLDRNFYFAPNQQNRDCWYGYEWVRLPGFPDIPSYYETQEFLGSAYTSPSYLHQYNKNDFFHECYFGEVYLNGQVTLPDFPSSVDLQAARKTFGFGGLRIFYPTVASTGELFHLYLGSPGIGVPSVWKHPHKDMYVGINVIPRDGGVVDDFISYGRSELTAKQMYENMLDGRIIHSQGKSVMNDVQVETSDIPDFRRPPLYGSEYFELYKYTGLRGALANAASSADGFHFSRLAGEIAMDGLVINTISSLSQRSDSSLRKAGSLGSKLLACFKLLPSVYLGYQYGIAAPLREYASLPGALENQFSDLGPLVGEHEKEFRGFTVKSRVSLNLGSPMSQEQAANLAYLARGGLSLDDIWELVPLSFVVDWFLNISSLFEAGRASQIYSELPVKSATFSTSFERDVPLPKGMRGNIVHRCYMREYLKGSSLPADVFDFSLNDIRGTLSLQNVDEGIALFLSYLI